MHAFCCVERALEVLQTCLRQAYGRRMSSIQRVSCGPSMWCMARQLQACVDDSCLWQHPSALHPPFFFQLFEPAAIRRQAFPHLDD